MHDFGGFAVALVLVVVVATVALWRALRPLDDEDVPHLHDGTDD